MKKRGEQEGEQKRMITVVIFNHTIYKPLLIKIKSGTNTRKREKEQEICQGEKRISGRQRRVSSIAAAI